MDSHSDDSAHLLVVQYCLDFKHTNNRRGYWVWRVYLNNLYWLGLFQNTEAIVGEAGQTSDVSAKLRPRFAYMYQWPDNVKLYTCKQARFNQNTQCGSRVMRIFTKRPRLAAD